MNERSGSLDAVLKEFFARWASLITAISFVFISVAVVNFETSHERRGWMNLLLALISVVVGISAVVVGRQGRSLLRRPRVRAVLFYCSSVASALLVGVIGLISNWRAELVVLLIIAATFAAGHVAGTEERGNSDNQQHTDLDAFDDAQERSS